MMRTGRRAGTTSLVVHLATGSGEDVTRPPRAGFVVSGKIGNSVVRHRITRRLRPLVRSRLTALPTGTDVVVRALAPASTASSTELAADLDIGLRVAAKRAGLVFRWENEQAER